MTRWPQKLRMEFEEYRDCLSLDRRKAIWLSWDNKEKGLVYVVSRTDLKKEQKAWKAELQSRGACASKQETQSAVRRQAPTLPPRPSHSASQATAGRPVSVSERPRPPDLPSKL